MQRCAAFTGSIGRVFLAMTLDGEKDGLIHEARLMEGHDVLAVGVVANVMDGLQFHERNSAARLLIDDRDPKPLTLRAWLGGNYNRQQKCLEAKHEDRSPTARTARTTSPSRLENRPSKAPLAPID
jgi:hypothetical protein